MLLCPFCKAENIAGEDHCQACGQPLPRDDKPFPRRKTDIEKSIETEPLSALRPALPVTVAPSDSVADVIRLLAERNIGCVLVVQRGSLVGIFSERDALMRIGTQFDEAAAQPIQDYMTPAPETLSTGDSIAFALNRMAVGDFRHIPIRDRDRPVGVISVRDVLGHLTRHFPEIAVEDY